MGSAIPFNLQFYVELHRNNTFEWLVFVLSVLVLALHGVLFHWIPIYLRGKRDSNGLPSKRYFKFLKRWDMWTSCAALKVPFKKDKVYFQPSLVLLGLAYTAILGVFSISQTADLNYQPRTYIICKRLLRVAIGNLPLIMIMVMRHDLVTSISGLQHDRLCFVHKWISRSMWVLITTHLILAIKYWLGLNFPVMIVIPPQIFGMISYGSFFMLIWASNKWLRKWAYELFLVQHRVFSFIMLLFAYFHNPGNHVIVLVSVHLLVLDRVLMKVLGIIHRRMSPNRGTCDFEILDEDTILVTMYVTKTRFAADRWYFRILPKFSTWNPGQHVYLNVQKVSFFQFHPFTISSLAENGEIKLIVRKQKGFTKNLYNKLLKMLSNEATEPEVSEIQGSHEEIEGSNADVIENYNESKQIFDEEYNISTQECPKTRDKLQLKAQFIGPFGAKHQPFLTFDICLFIGAGSGGSFTFPVALELVQEVRRRDQAHDYLFRPNKQIVHLIWIIKSRKNEIWFEHAIEPLYEFIKSGRIKLTIYITQEDLEMRDESFNSSKMSMNFRESFNTLEFQSTSETRDSANIERLYGRPDVSSLIRDYAKGLSDPVNTKSLSVCSCGPELLTASVKAECQINRWATNAPDIYCYTESF